MTRRGVEPNVHTGTSDQHQNQIRTDGAGYFDESTIGMAMSQILAGTAAAAVLLLFAARPANAEWNGHLAKLSEAQAACRDIDSRVCEPFLAEAVAVSALLQEQAKIVKVGGEEKILMPGSSMTIFTCGLPVFNRLNGESLLHMAIAIPATGTGDLYWTQALRAAALQSCTGEPASR